MKGRELLEGRMHDAGQRVKLGVVPAGRFVASNVTGGVIPNSGHWLMEEQPAAMVAAIRTFLDR